MEVDGVRLSVFKKIPAPFAFGELVGASQEIVVSRSPENGDPQRKIGGFVTAGNGTPR